MRAHVAEDAQERAALAERFHHAQTFMQDDPWEQRANGAESHLHRPLVPAE